MLRGFDVSFATDWARLQTDEGICFGVARCMRSTETKDPEFDANWARMAQLDEFVRMAYMFASPALGSDAVEDARLAWQYVVSAGPLRSTDVFWLDLEQSVLGQDDTNKWAEAWFDEFVRLNRAAGYSHVPSLYNGGYLMNRTGVNLNQRFAYLWYPRPESRYDNTWPTTFTPKLPLGAASWADTNWGVPPDIWQCSFHWHVPGFPDHDANVFDGTLAELQAFNQEEEAVSLLPCKKGDGPSDVVEYWQRCLRTLGFYPNQTTSRVYDVTTEKAVNDFRHSRDPNVADVTRITPWTAEQIHEARFKGEKGDPGKTPTKVTVHLSGDMPADVTATT